MQTWNPDHADGDAEKSRHRLAQTTNVQTRDLAEAEAGKSTSN